MLTAKIPQAHSNVAANKVLSVTGSVAPWVCINWSRDCHHECPLTSLLDHFPKNFLCNIPVFVRDLK